MSAIDVRAEATERIARKIYEDATPSSILPTWEQATEKKRAVFLWMAGQYVDALGDLLPDAYVESRGGADVLDGAGEIARRIPLEERYMTEWRVVE